MRCTTFTKLPVAFSGGSKLSTAPVAPAIESTCPLNVLPYVSTFTSAFCPGFLFFNCVSLKFAVTQTLCSGTTTSNPCPCCTTCPISTCLCVTTPSTGAVIVAYYKFSCAASTGASACCTFAILAAASACLIATCFVSAFAASTPASA